jgi:hypothetical protein
MQCFEYIYIRISVISAIFLIHHLIIVHFLHTFKRSHKFKQRKSVTTVCGRDNENRK